MSQKTSHYHAYLLRFWRDGEHTAWRASLEDPHTGETFGFATVQRLYEFLDEVRGDPNARTGNDSPDEGKEL